MGIPYNVNYAYNGQAKKKREGEGKERMLYSDEQLRRADLAETLHISMDHPSDEHMSKFISSPSTINCPITVQDLKNLRAIKGPCAQCLEGKPKPNKGSNSTNDPVEPTSPGEMVLHCDIVFIVGKPRPLTTDHVSGYTTFTIMETKMTQHVQNQCISRLPEGGQIHFSRC